MADLSDAQFRKFVEETAQTVGAEYEQLGNEVRRLVEDGSNQELTLAKKAAILAAISVLLQQAQARTDNILITIVPAAYQEGIAATNARLPKALAAAELSPGHTAIVNTLLEDASLDFGVGLDGVRKSANQVLSRTLQEQVRDRISEGLVEGRGVPTIARNVLDQLREQGFTTLVRSDGRHMNLKAYSEMLTRTQIVRAANEGTVQRANELGITIFQMSKHPGTQDDACLSVEGKLFDTTGKRYPTPPQMPIHPNCRHILLPRPDLS